MLNVFTVMGVSAPFGNDFQDRFEETGNHGRKRPWKEETGDDEENALRVFTMQHVTVPDEERM